MKVGTVVDDIFFPVPEIKAVLQLRFSLKIRTCFCSTHGKKWWFENHPPQFLLPREVRKENPLALIKRLFGREIKVYTFIFAGGSSGGLTSLLLSLIEIHIFYDWKGRYLVIITIIFIFYLFFIIPIFFVHYVLSLYSLLRYSVLFSNTHLCGRPLEFHPNRHLF